MGKVVIASRSGDAYPREVQMLTHVALIEVCAMRPHVNPLEINANCSTGRMLRQFVALLCTQDFGDDAKRLRDCELADCE